jgi:hypothetical protein
MTKIKALVGILLGCGVMIVLAMVFYNLGFVANITGLLGALVAIFLGFLFSKGDTPIFTAVMTGILCFGTAFFVSVYLPAKEVVGVFADSLKENKTYYTEFMDAYNQDPDFAESYVTETDDFYVMVYDDWYYLTEELNGNVDEFKKQYENEWITPIENRSKMSYWFAHAGSFISGKDKYLMVTDIDQDVFNLLAYNVLGVFLAVGILASKIAKEW